MIFFSGRERMRNKGEKQGYKETGNNGKERENYERKNVGERLHKKRLGNRTMEK